MCQMTFACGNDNDFCYVDNNEMQTKDKQPNDGGSEGMRVQGATGQDITAGRVHRATFAFACHIRK